MTRRGMMMLEAIVAGTLLGTLLVICLQLLSAAAAQRRAADQRQCAILNWPTSWSESPPGLGPN